jgi:hypothetical protein
MGGIAAPAPHQAVKGGKIGPGTTFSKKFAGTHSCQLLHNSGCNELVDAGAILLCAALELRLDRARQAERVGALGNLSSSEWGRIASCLDAA